jgi:hypothetical protein
MSQSKEAKNKALVLEAFETLFNRRDYVTAEQYFQDEATQEQSKSGNPMFGDEFPKYS